MMDGNAYGSGSERELANNLAKRLDTYIPCDISFAFWALPLLAVMLDRIEDLERRLDATP
jgi:hypothetical protein